MEFKPFWNKTKEKAKTAGVATAEFTKENAAKAKAEFDKQVAERNLRFNDPTFQEMLKGEKEKTVEAIRVTGEKALGTINGLLVRTILKPLWESAKKISGLSKGKADELAWSAIGVDIFKGLGSGIVNGTQLVAASFVAVGRTARLGIVYSLAPKVKTGATEQATGEQTNAEGEEPEAAAEPAEEAVDVPAAEEVIITPAPEAVAALEVAEDVAEEVAEVAAEDEVPAPESAAEAPEDVAAEKTISPEEREQRAEALLKTIVESLEKEGEGGRAEAFQATYTKERVQDVSEVEALFSAIAGIARENAEKYKPLFEQTVQALLGEGYIVRWHRDGTSYQPAVMAPDGSTFLKGKKPKVS